MAGWLSAHEATETVEDAAGKWNGEAKYEQELSTIVLVIVKKVRVMKRSDSNFLFSMLEMASGLYTCQWPHKGHNSQGPETSLTLRVEEQSGYSHGGTLRASSVVMLDLHIIVLLHFAIYARHLWEITTHHSAVALKSTLGPPLWHDSWPNLPRKWRIMHASRMSIIFDS